MEGIDICVFFSFCATILAALIVISNAGKQQMETEMLATYCDKHLNIKGTIQPNTVNCFAQRSFELDNIKIFSIRIKEIVKSGF